MSDTDRPKKAAALQYDRDQDRAPRLVAKGQGHLAEREDRREAPFQPDEEA